MILMTDYDPPVIHQMRRSGLVWAPSYRSVHNWPDGDAEGLADFLEIERESGRGKEVRRRLENALRINRPEIYELL